LGRHGEKERTLCRGRRSPKLKDSEEATIPTENIFTLRRMINRTGGGRTNRPSNSPRSVRKLKKEQEKELKRKKDSRQHGREIKGAVAGKTQEKNRSGRRKSLTMRRSIIKRKKETKK